MPGQRSTEGPSPREALFAGQDVVRSSAALSTSISTQLTSPLNALSVARVRRNRRPASSPRHGFVVGVTEGLGISTRPSPVFSAIREERHVAALAQATAVVGELHPDLVLAGRDRLRALDEEVLDPVEDKSELRASRLSRRD